MGRQALVREPCALACQRHTRQYVTDASPLELSRHGSHTAKCACLCDGEGEREREQGTNHVCVCARGGGGECSGGFDAVGRGVCAHDGRARALQIGGGMRAAHLDERGLGRASCPLPWQAPFSAAWWPDYDDLSVSGLSSSNASTTQRILLAGPNQVGTKISYLAPKVLHIQNALKRGR
jgi:hypothetical protein